MDIDETKCNVFVAFPLMRKPRHSYQKYASTLIISNVLFDFLYHQIVVMAILDLCKLEKFPKVATLTRGGFGCWKP